MTKDPKEVFQDAVKAARTMDGFDNFVSRLGLNNDNALSAGTYAFNLVTRNRIKLEAAYRGSWIVGAVIDSVAEDMTRAGIEISSNEDEADIKDVQSMISRLRLWHAYQLLAKWGRLYGGAIGVHQIEGQDLSTPLDIDTIAQGQYKGIVVFDRWQLNPVLADVIESGPDMGLPRYYQIVNNPTQLDPEAPTATGMQTVHYTRCIRYVGIELPYFQAITEMMWGESILERLFDRLIAFDNATMSSASLIDRANLRTVQVNGLREIIAAGGPAYEGLLAQFEMMRSVQVNEGLTLLDKEDTFASTAYSFAGLSDMMLQFGQQLSGASKIPLVRLFGQSPAGLSSTGDADIRLYYDNVNAEQESKFRSGWEATLKILWRSTYGKPAPKDLEFTFTPLWQMSATDKVNIAKTTAEAVSGAHESGLISLPTAMKELRQSAGDTGIFSNITDEDIERAEEQALEEPPMPEAEMPAPQAEGADTDKVPLAETGLNEYPRKPVVKDAFSKLKAWLARDAKEFKENEHPRKKDGKFGSGGGGGKSESSEKKSGSSEKEESSKAPLHERINEAEAKLKKLKADAKRAQSRADTAPDRAEKDPKSLRDANAKVKAYNEQAEIYNKLLDERDEAKKKKPKEKPKSEGAEKKEKPEAEKKPAETKKSETYSRESLPENVEIPDQHLPSSDIDKEVGENHRLNTVESIQYAVRNNKVVGHLGIDEDGAVKAVYVDPEFRGKGIAKSLYEDYMKENSYLKSDDPEAMEPSAKKLWEKLKSEHPNEIKKTSEGWIWEKKKS